MQANGILDKITYPCLNMVFARKKHSGKQAFLGGA